MRKVFWVLKGYINWIWRGIFISVFLASMLFNVVAIFGGTLFTAVSGAVGTITGARTLIASHANEVAELNAEVVAERRVQRELRRQVAELSGDLAIARTANRELREQATELGEELASSRVALRQAQSEAVDLADNVASERLARRQLRDEIGDGMVDFGSKRITLRQAVEETTDRVSSRAAKSAKRDIGSMVGESIPYFGTAIIVAVTAMEISDLCATIKDMNALKRAFNRESEPSPEELTVCSMSVPSRMEIWDAAVASPGKAWRYAEESLPTLQELQSIELPSWMTMTSFLQGLADMSSEKWSATTEQSEKWWRWMTE